MNNELTISSADSYQETSQPVSSSGSCYQTIRRQEARLQIDKFAIKALLMQYMREHHTRCIYIDETAHFSAHEFTSEVDDGSKPTIYINA